MRLNPTLEPPRAPILTVREIPPEYHEIGHSIRQRLEDMRSEAKSVAVSVALFQYCRSMPIEAGSLYLEWPMIAAKTAALSVRNYGVALAALRSSIGQIPAWMEKVDAKSLKEEEKRFNLAFPFAHKTRHSIAHPELYSDHTKQMGTSNPVDIPGMIKKEGSGSLTIQSGLFNETYTATFEGQIIELTVNLETVQILNSITRECFRAFSTLDPTHAMIEQALKANSSGHPTQRRREGQ